MTDTLQSRLRSGAVTPADLDAAADRIDALEAGPRVKPLVWKDLADYFAKAEAPLFGNIRVESYGSGFAVSWSVPGFSDAFCDGRWPTRDAAKAAAQADYERRILAALE